jgi:hypothetical protein
MSEGTATVFEDRDPLRRYEAIASENFDRIRFAMRALELLAPPQMTVAVYPGCAELRIARGRDLSRGEGASWALVGIPRHATRQRIALALAELTGHGGSRFVVDLLVLADGASPSAKGA